LAGGLKALCSDFVPFDIILVVTGLTASVLESSDKSSTWVGLEIILVLRVFRLLRLLRALRMLKYFEQLWKLVRDLLSSTSVMMSTVALLTMTLYIAACFGVEIIAKDPMLRSIPETKYVIDQHFSSIEIVMMSFTQFVTVDSIANIYWPIVRHRKLLFFYFGLVIVTVSVALMNLVTAHLVEASISHSMRDREMEKYKLRKLRPEILKAFRAMDQDSDMLLTRQEVAQFHSGLPAEILKIVPQESFLELFDFLDSDESGSITEQEFIDGVEQLVMSNLSFKDMYQLRTLTQIRVRLDKCLTDMVTVDFRLKKLSRVRPSQPTSQPKHASGTRHDKWSCKVSPTADISL